MLFAYLHEELKIQSHTNTNMIKSFKCKETEKYIELTTAGEMLKEEFIDAFNITQNALARAIFVPPNRIHQIVNNKRSITADTDLRLTKFFGLSQGYFLRYQEDYELRKAKRKISEDMKKIIPIQKLNYKQG